MSTDYSWIKLGTEFIRSALNKVGHTYVSAKKKLDKPFTVPVLDEMGHTVLDTNKLIQTRKTTANKELASVAAGLMPSAIATVGLPTFAASTAFGIAGGKVGGWAGRKGAGFLGLDNNAKELFHDVGEFTGASIGAAKGSQYEIHLKKPNQTLKSDVFPIEITAKTPKYKYDGHYGAGKKRSDGKIAEAKISGREYKKDDVLFPLKLHAPKGSEIRGNAVYINGKPALATPGYVGYDQSEMANAVSNAMDNPILQTRADMGDASVKEILNGGQRFLDLTARGKTGPRFNTTYGGTPEASQVMIGTNLVVPGQYDSTVLGSGWKGFSYTTRGKGTTSGGLAYLANDKRGVLNYSTTTPEIVDNTLAKFKGTLKGKLQEYYQLVKDFETKYNIDPSNPLIPTMAFKDADFKYYMDGKTALSQAGLDNLRPAAYVKPNQLQIVSGDALGKTYTQLKGVEFKQGANLYGKDFDGLNENVHVKKGLETTVGNDPSVSMYVLHNAFNPMGIQTTGINSKKVLLRFGYKLGGKIIEK